ncbi:MAG: response regulator, partial [Vicinamibacteria bacterium]
MSEPTPDPPPASATPTVLLAEDHAEVRALVSGALRRRGYTVIVAANGHEALAAAREVGRVDVLVTDLGMPGMGGLELAAALRASSPRLPIVFFSGCLVDAPPVGGAPDALQV